MANPVSSSGPVQTFYTPCNWVNDLCKAVYEIAKKILQAISHCFSSPSQEMTLLAPGRTVASPSQGTAVAPSRIGGAAADPRNLLSFYRGLEANNHGVTLNQILSWNDGQLETVHNYIQWLFPLTTFSNSNPTAPILDQAMIQTFRNDASLKNQVLQSFRRMLSFYGLQMNETAREITRASNFNTRIAVWLQDPSGHHNFLRISRMILSLHLLGLSEYGTAFFNVMGDIYRHEGQGLISSQTFNHWARAQRGS